MIFLELLEFLERLSTTKRLLDVIGDPPLHNLQYMPKVCTRRWEVSFDKARQSILH